MCYAACAAWDGHNHDVSFYACDSDPILSDTRLQQHQWIVRRNASKRLWYEHDATGYKTYIRPMTAVCELPPGWEPKKDPEGKIYYENTMTGQLSRTLPGALPLGWQEAKDPDGKLFFVHHELQLASWHRPGEQPPIRRPDSGTEPKASGSVGNTTKVIVPHSKPNAVSQANQAGVASSPVIVKPNAVSQANQAGAASSPAVVKPNAASKVNHTGAPSNHVIAKPNVTAVTATVNSTSLPQVTLQTAAEATINLIDPSQGSIVYNTKIATHIAHKGVTSTFKSIKNSERLQKFAKGTGITAASRQVQSAWTKAEREVIESNKRALAISRSRSQGAKISLEVGGGVHGGKVMESDGAHGQLQHTVEPQNENKVHQSHIVSSGQESNEQQQHQNESHEYQSPQQYTNLPTSTNLIPNPQLDEITQGLYAGQNLDTYTNQIQNMLIAQGEMQDIIIAQGQDFNTEQGFTICPDMSVGDLSLANMGIGQGFGIDDKLGGVGYNLQEVGVDGVDVDVTVDFPAGIDLDSILNF